MSTAVVDETSGGNSHRPWLQSSENIPKCKLIAVLVNVLFTSHGSDRVVACRKHRLKFDNRHLVPINVFQNVHFGVLRN
ncbi:hypothetical protein HUJ04_002945 [Dendroctonus ponderosae]|nr:hypothetical protein HUJ04_002945 [Dendroctonus ponderosae]